MRTKRFTALAVENFKPKAERYEVTDSSGLILFVGQTGHKGWGIRYRRPGSRKPAKFMVGSWPAMSLRKLASPLPLQNLMSRTAPIRVRPRKERRPRPRPPRPTLPPTPSSAGPRSFEGARTQEDAPAQSEPG